MNRIDGAKVGVIGAGTMGIGIAITAIRSGFETVLSDSREAQLPVARGNADGFLDQGVKRGKITQEEADAAKSRLTLVTELGHLADCDIVIEAISEDLSAKQKLFEKLGALAAPETIFVTNTSTLSVTSISAGAPLPGQVVGMHFCNPAPLMPLIEVVDGMLTTPETHQFALGFAAALGKTTVEVRDTPGFILNRLLIPFENSCIRQLEAGAASVEDIDRAIRVGLGYPMGVFELLDTVGLDVHRAVSLSLFDQLRDPKYAPPPLVDQMIAVGHLGRKSGRGFYTYESPGMFGA